MIQEKTFSPVSGWFPLLFTILLLVGGPFVIVYAANQLADGNVGSGGPVLAAGILCFLLGLLMLFGFQAIAPNQARRRHRSLP